MPEQCSVEGCESRAQKRGWCNRHYLRWWFHGDPTKTLTAEKGALRKWVERHKEWTGEDCLMWPFGKIGDGYSQFKLDGKWMRVNRFMCEHRHGPPPTAKHEAAHTCGKGSAGCVNPRHLVWKTATENQADRVQHGTSNRGQRQWLAKFTEAQVLEIRASTDSTDVLANRYGVRPATIDAIAKRVNWFWL